MSATAEFRMPSLGADMDEGTLVEWLVAPGDRVRRGQIVAVVDTAKAAIEVEVFSEGVVDELLVEPGTTVAVGTPLARLTGTGEQPPPEPAAAPEPAQAAAAAPVPVAPAHPVAASPIVRHLAHEHGVDLAALHGSGPHGEVTRADVAAASAPGPAPVAPPVPEQAAPGTSAAERSDESRVRASPLARRRAQERSVDLATVNGTGPDGVVTVADVDAAAANVPATAPVTPAPHPAAPSRRRAARRSGKKQHEKDEAVAKQAAMREAIGALMARSKREIPHYYLRTTIDLASALAWLREHNAAVGVEERLVPAALLLKASALAAREVPEVNGCYVDGRFEPADHVHLGVAVALRGGGLVAPAIHDADTLSLPELMAGLKDLVARARSGRLRASQMADPTLTVTNLGDQGVEEVQGVIYPPQVALVGFGKVVERPWAVDGHLGVHPVVVATLAADHRVTDGHQGGRYLAAVEGHLQRPAELDATAS